MNGSGRSKQGPQDDTLSVRISPHLPRRCEAFRAKARTVQAQDMIAFQDVDATEESFRQFVHD
jgi:hypothetical protein